MPKIDFGPLSHEKNQGTETLKKTAKVGAAGGVREAGGGVRRNVFGNRDTQGIIFT